MRYHWALPQVKHSTSGDATNEEKARHQSVHCTGCYVVRKDLYANIVYSLQQIVTLPNSIQTEDIVNESDAVPCSVLLLTLTNVCTIMLRIMHK